MSTRQIDRPLSRRSERGSNTEARSVRSFLLILLTVAVIGGGFLVYAWLEPTHADRPGRTLTKLSDVERPEEAPSLRGIGSGKEGWVYRYDPETGELASQYRGERFEPQK